MTTASKAAALLSRGVSNPKKAVNARNPDALRLGAKIELNEKGRGATRCLGNLSLGYTILEGLGLHCGRSTCNVHGHPIPTSSGDRDNVQICGGGFTCHS